MMSQNITYDKNFFKKLLKQIAGKITEEDGDLIPEIFIRGSGYIWCYQPNSKTMIRISRGTKGYIVSDEEDEQGRVMIYVDANEIVLIDKEEILDLGFN